MPLIKRYVSLSTITGVLFLCAGMRDLFVPGFLSISPRVPDPDEAAVYIIIGLMFFGLAAARKKATDRSPVA